MAEDWGYKSRIEVIDSVLDVDGKFIVDAGCGDGNLCRHLAGRGARVLGIEPDPVQCAKNEKSPVVANVGFKQAGAAALPVEPNSVDGIVFSNSLHHVYAPEYEKVFDEIARVLNSSGFLFVIEPVAHGSGHYVMAPFHDETSVRLAAYEALVKYADPKFAAMREIYFDIDSTYETFGKFVENYQGKDFNSYTGDVDQPEVKKRFEACENSHGSYTLTQPMRVNYYTQIKL